MRLVTECEHGTRSVEIDEGREGIGNTVASGGEPSFARQFVAEVMPRCPYCEMMHPQAAQRPSVK